MPEKSEAMMDILAWSLKSIRFVRIVLWINVKELMIRTRPNTLIKSFKTGS